MNESGNLDARLMRAIDAELRESTETHVWTHEDLHSMPRLVLLCDRLGVSAPALLLRALAKVEPAEDGHEPA